jgi:hypothetical protein
MKPKSAIRKVKKMVKKSPTERSLYPRVFPRAISNAEKAVTEPTVKSAKPIRKSPRERAQIPIPKITTPSPILREATVRTDFGTFILHPWEVAVA